MRIYRVQLHASAEASQIGAWYEWHFGHTQGSAAPTNRQVGERLLLDTVPGFVAGWPGGFRARFVQVRSGEDGDWGPVEQYNAAAVPPASISLSLPPSVCAVILRKAWTGDRYVTGRLFVSPLRTDHHNPADPAKATGQSGLLNPWLLYTSQAQFFGTSNVLRSVVHDEKSGAWLVCSLFGFATYYGTRRSRLTEVLPP